MALSFSLSPEGIGFGLATGITIRQLSLFGAVQLTMTEAGGMPVLELLAAWVPAIYK